MPTKRYDALSVKVGRQFFGTLSVELNGVRSRKWNSDRVVGFSWLPCNALKALIMPNIFLRAYFSDSTALIVRRLEKLMKDTFNTATGFLGKYLGIQNYEEYHRTF